MDGNDKLKKFGFALHGCIDGLVLAITCEYILHALVHKLSIHQTSRHSRKLLWLRITPTNNDPKVIVKYYLDAVGEFEGIKSLDDIALILVSYDSFQFILGCPQIIRSDYGTETLFLQLFT